MRYINPGYAELLDVDGGTTISDAAYNPTHGVALYQPTDNDGVTLGSTVTELYGKFDFFLPSSFGNLPSNYFLKVGIYNGGSDGSTAGFTGFAMYKYSTYYLRFRACGSRSGYAKEKSISDSSYSPAVLNGINHIWFHFKSSTGDNEFNGEYEVYVNGVCVLEGTNNGGYFGDCSKLVVYAANAYSPIAKIILSDTAVNKKEQITAIPLANPVTDMVDRGDGSYMAESAGQQILSTVDVASLITNYGGTSPVTGIAIAGNPAYRTGEGLTSLIGISKASGTQTEHGAKTLRTSTTAGAADCYTVNMTLSDMVGMQLGWKAGV